MIRDKERRLKCLLVVPEGYDSYTNVYTVYMTISQIERFLSPEDSDFKCDLADE